MKAKNMPKNRRERVICPHVGRPAARIMEARRRHGRAKLQRRPFVFFLNCSLVALLLRAID